MKKVVPDGFFSLEDVVNATDASRLTEARVEKMLEWQNWRIESVNGCQPQEVYAITTCKTWSQNWWEFLSTTWISTGSTCSTSLCNYGSTPLPSLAPADQGWSKAFVLKVDIFVPRPGCTTKDGKRTSISWREYRDGAIEYWTAGQLCRDASCETSLMT